MLVRVFAIRHAVLALLLAALSACGPSSTTPTLTLLDPRHGHQVPVICIAPCFPQGLKRAQSVQIGSHDTVFPRIRYAVPTSLAPTASRPPAGHASSNTGTS